MLGGCGTRLSDKRYASVIEDDDGTARLVVASADREVAFVLVIPEFRSPAEELAALDARFTLVSELEKEGS